MPTDIFSFWEQIDPKDKIHPADKDVFNRVRHNFDLRCLPGAFVGPLRTSPIVLLYLSPGWDQSDVDEASTPGGQQRYVEQRQGYAPFPSPDKYFGAWKWWSERTRVFGPWEELQDKVAVLNIGGYHSKKFRDYSLLTSLPSCRVSVDWAQLTLFPEALAGHRVVICLRSASYWGLAKDKVFGKSLYATSVTLGGHMHKGRLRDEIIKKVKERLKS